MERKDRTRIPDDIAADVMFAHDRTCCVCNETGKPVQIHQIDDNPSNNRKIWPYSVSMITRKRRSMAVLAGSFEALTLQNSVTRGLVGFASEETPRISYLSKKEAAFLA
jgi:hypothetical protein